MTREEFAIFLKKLKTANDNGQDVDAIVKEHEHRNVYFYNDGSIKKILASEKNLMLTTEAHRTVRRRPQPHRPMAPRHRHPQPRGRLQRIRERPRV
jgi:hypothetical protein